VKFTPESSQLPPSDPTPAVGPEPVEGLSHDEKNRRSPGQSEILNPNSEIPLLTPEEKRRILARIVRVNPLDCFDESGAFDLARAKKVLPPGAIRHIAIHETIRPNAEGQPVTERRIQVRLVDPLSALRLDDQLERRRERTASSSSSDTAADPDAPPPHPASPEYAHMLLRQKTKGLDEANHTLALLKKALAAAGDRQLQLSKKLDEKDCQLLQTLGLSNGSETLSLSNGSQTLSKVEGDAAQRDAGCQPVQEKAEASTSCRSEDPNSQTLSSPGGQPLSHAEGDTLSEAERIAKKRRESAARSLEREIEHARNTSGHGAFTNWLRRRGLDPANYPSPPLPTKPHSARPPP